jgi:hypothetical protein
MHRYVALPAIIPILVMLSAGIGAAQTSPAPPASPPAQAAPSGPPACSPDARSSTDASGQSNLSDRLANQNGVICPPADVDPQMRVPPPGGGRMLVVPPPGGPGGDPNTIPK